MKKIFFIAASILVFNACKNNTAPTSATGETVTTEKATTTDNVPDGRFDDKSGILVTETDMMGMGKSTLKMTFDDYGKKMLNEMTMSMMGKQIHSFSLIKDGFIYTWTDMANMAMKMKLDENLDDKTIDYKNMSEEMRKKLNLKEEGNETVDGKDCKVFSFSMKEGMKGKSWVWKGLPVQSEMEMQGKKILTKFKDYQTNVSIPSSTFDLPTGVEFKEMNVDKTTAAK
jgi:outer membrane lipoprotein-sorting protein